jgi:hypothetical protein
MRKAVALFESNIIAARQLEGLHGALTKTIAAPLSYDDLLRSQIVYAVSAFDKLIHDLVRLGMVETFSGVRQATAKYLAETVSIEMHAKLVAATMPPKEIIFEQELFRKHKTLSFQDPEKVADALAYIWPEQHKWQKIALAMGVSQDYATKRLRLIVDRRNAIVHEADLDPVSATKLPINAVESRDITDFLQSCALAIASLVT